MGHASTIDTFPRPSTQDREAPEAPQGPINVRDWKGRIRADRAIPEAPMLFKTLHSLSLLQGKLAPVAGRTRIVDLNGRDYGSEDVAFAIPDDEAQAGAIVAAGYRIHTPMSMHLGAGATEL